MLAPEALALAAELESLGGGEARVGSGSAIACVRPAAAPVVAARGERVLVRDPRCPADTPEAAAVRKFRISAAADGPDEIFDEAGAPAIEWLLAGFSTATVALGESGSGKSHALFGPTDAEPDCHGLCPRVIAALYDAIDARGVIGADGDGLGDRSAARASADADEERQRGLTLGIACWEVRHDRVVDLLCAGGGDGLQAGGAATAGGTHPYVLVHAPSRHEAFRLVALARARSVATPSAASPSRASLFIRFALHDAERQSLASLYLVDLVGAAPLPNAAEAAALAAALAGSHAAPSARGPSLTPGALVAERRGLNRQHAAVHRLFTELGALDESSGPQQVLGARDSRLTQQLAPLVVGSCRAQVLACVNSDAGHFAETCATLRAASSALAIRAPCLRVSDVLLSDVRMLQPQAVLPPPASLLRPTSTLAVRHADTGIGKFVYKRFDEAVLGDAAVGAAPASVQEPLGWEDEYDAPTPKDMVGPAGSCARLRGAGRSGDAASPKASSTDPSAEILRAELKELGTPSPTRSSPRGASASDPDPAGWVTRELERRVQEELAIARGARGGAPPSTQPPTNAPPVMLAEHAPVIRSYAAQHAAYSDVQARQSSLAGLASPPRAAASGYAPSKASLGEASGRPSLEPQRGEMSEGAGGQTRAVAEAEAAIAVQAEAEAHAALDEAHALSRELAAKAEAKTLAHDDAIDVSEPAETLHEGNYETVLSLLKESDDSRKADKLRTDEAEREAAEQATLREIALAEEKAKVIELRKKLRRLQSTSVRKRLEPAEPAPASPFKWQP